MAENNRSTSSASSFMTQSARDTVLMSPDEQYSTQFSGEAGDADPVYLKEDSEDKNDIENELHSYDSVVGYVSNAFRKAKDGRREQEELWLKSYRNYRGIYGPDVQFTDTEQSRAFIKITKTKVLAAYAQVTDVLFSGDKFPIGVEASKFPVGGVVEKAHFDPDEITEESAAKQKQEMGGPPSPDGAMEPAPQSPPSVSSSAVSRPSILERLGVLRESLTRVSKARESADDPSAMPELKEGAGTTPTSFTFEPAKETAKKFESKIHTQLAESDADKHLRTIAFECALYGTGIMKGPFAQTKEYPRWTEEGEYSPEMQTIPKIESRTLWQVYFDPDARSYEDLSYVIDRHRMTRSQLRGLKRRPYFRSESIEIALDKGPSYVEEYWESILRDNDGNVTSDRYEVLEYWGYMDAQLAELAGLDIPEELEDQDELQINVWVCNGAILRLVLNPFKPSRMPYRAIPYEINPYSIYGIGVAENMEDTQLVMNGFTRLMIDNAALSSNIILELDENSLVPNQDLKVRPGMIIRRQAGAPGQAMFSTKIQNVTQECILVFDKMRQLADEATGLPSYSHGMSGIMSVGRTSSGMSMLMGAADRNIKAVIKNFDDYLLTPLGHDMYAFNMQFNFDKEFTKGDLRIIAKGTDSLMRTEIRSQRLMQFLQITANPVMAPFTKFDYLLREIAESLDIDPELAVNDPREAGIQAAFMAELAKLMGPPPGMAEGGGGGGPPNVDDPTGSGGGNIGPGNSPLPGMDGFTGNNEGGGPPPQQQQQTPAPQMPPM